MDINSTITTNMLPTHCILAVSIMEVTTESGFWDHEVFRDIDISKLETTQPRSSHLIEFVSLTRDGVLSVREENGLVRKREFMRWSFTSQPSLDPDPAIVDDVAHVSGLDILIYVQEGFIDKIIDTITGKEVVI